MAFSVLRSVVKCTRSVCVLKRPKNVINICRCATPLAATIRPHSNLQAPAGGLGHVQKTKNISSSSESDSDLEPPGHRGETQFWRRKIRTFHGILDVNKDGVISYDDFKLLAERFIKLGHLSEKHTHEFQNLLKDLWEKRWGPISPYNLVTVEQFLEDMHHVINDKHLVRRAHSFLPYLFRALDKDQSGEISEDEFKLFFQCLGLQEEDAILAFRSMDEDGDGVVTMKEFVKHGREFFLTEDENKISKYFFGPLMEH
ncbi:sarcoplasmic calcium-binding protein [Tribolium madens]|uniref:sarcoplasmic calcium-binding protein n=1 Tax=Tribolium madens TaxID=41895 RepID=UPI001CF7592D|nr:sarcoplasmic calcium-binding protein [Tribolium madens]